MDRAHGQCERHRPARTQRRQEDGPKQVHVTDPTPQLAVPMRPATSALLPCTSSVQIAARLINILVN